jgi:hypothetical protein
VRSLSRLRTKTFEARVVGAANDIDLAVLKIDATNLHSVPIADYDALRKGDLVFAIGSPGSLRDSVTMGIVSAVARQLESDSPLVYVQTDAPINPGSSGGARQHGRRAGGHQRLDLESHRRQRGARLCDSELGRRRGVPEAPDLGPPGARRNRPVGGEFPIVLSRRLNESTVAVMQSDPGPFSGPGFTQGRRTGVAFNRSTSRGTDCSARASRTSQAAIGV